MRPIVLLITAIILFVSCSNDDVIQRDTSSQNPLPETAKISKPPLAITFHSVRHNDKDVDLSFIVEHTNDLPIALNDYQFHWPKYISDDNEVIYEVKSVDFNHSKINSQSLTNNQLAVTLTVSPPPEGNLDQLMQVPFYIVPRLFEQGYPFRIEKNGVTRIEVGDLILENATVKGKSITFNLFDHYPDQHRRNLAYLFTITQDNQDIYPMFSRVDPEENHLQIQLDFAQEIALPAQLSIERTTVDLPEWRFSFVIPIIDQPDE